jgi:hypothetical protein
VNARTEQLNERKFKQPTILQDKWNIKMSETLSKDIIEVPHPRALSISTQKERWKMTIDVTEN